MSEPREGLYPEQIFEAKVKYIDKDIILCGAKRRRPKDLDELL